MTIEIMPRASNVSHEHEICRPGSATDIQSVYTQSPKKIPTHPSAYESLSNLVAAMVSNT